MDLAALLNSGKKGQNGARKTNKGLKKKPAGQNRPARRNRGASHGDDSDEVVVAMLLG